MHDRLFVHPYQLEDSTYFAIFKTQGKTFYRHVDLCLRRAQANRFMIELRHSPVEAGDWIRLDQATFTGRLSWTPKILLTDLAVPYSLRVASERIRAYRLTYQVDACLFVHPTSFATELEAGQARRELQRDLSSLAEWDLLDEAATRVERPRFEIHRDDAVTYRIEMMAPSAIYRHPESFQSYGDAKLACDEILARHGNEHGAVADPSRLIQALDGESEPWEYDPQARKKSREYSFFNLGLARQAWANSFRLWNRDRFRGTAMLREGATVRVTATPSLFREKIQWQVREFQHVSSEVSGRVA